MPGMGAAERASDHPTRLLLHAATNARWCMQDLAGLRAKGWDTVSLPSVSFQDLSPSHSETGGSC